MRKCLIMFFLITITIVLCLPNISNAAKKKPNEPLRCGDVLAEDYDECPDALKGVEFNAESIRAAVVNGANELSFVDAFDYFINGVDIDKLNTAAKKEYVTIMTEFSNLLEVKEGEYAMYGGMDVLKSVEAYCTQNGTKQEIADKITELIKKAGGTKADVQQAQTDIQDAQNNQDASHSDNTQEVVDTIAEGAENNHREPKKYYTLGQSGADKHGQGMETKTIADIMNDGKTFEGNAGKGDVDVIENGDIKKLSDFLYNLLLGVAVVVAVVVGGIIGMKFMTGSAEQKAETKQYLVPYIVGCAVVFGAFGIWSIVVTILESVKG